MKEYFALQFRMMNRRFTDAKIKSWLAYLILLLLFVSVSLYLFYKTEYACYIYVLMGSMLITKLSETKRTEFLSLCFGDIQVKKIRLIENLICATPFVLFLIFKQFLPLAVLLLVIASILSFANFKTSFHFTIWTPFSKKPFEFAVGFRNSFYIILIAYALSIVAVVAHNFNLGAFALFLIFATTLSYYAQPEQEYYVWSFKSTAQGFLIDKIKTALLFATALALPVLLVIAFFYPQNIGVLLLFLLLAWAFLTCMIVGKYSTYPDEMGIIQAILIALCIGFPPLLILLIPYLFIKSKNRLSHYLQ